MASTGNLQTDQLFKGLTRPPMILGVSFSFALLNIAASLLLYVITTQMTILLLIMPAIHCTGYIICFSEPLFIELFMIKNQKCNKCSNVFYYGANSYDVT